MKTSTKIFSLSLLLTVGLLPLGVAQESELAAVGTDKPRNDAYLLKFQDSAASNANEGGYQSSFEFGGTDRPISNRYRAVLPYCASEHTFGCIQSIEIRDLSESQWEKLTPGEKFWNGPIASFRPNPDGTKVDNPWLMWEGDGGIGLPPSGKVQIFNSIKHQHGGGNSYVVKSLMSGNDLVKGRFNLNAFSLSIIPVKVLKYDPTVVGSKEIFSVQNYRFPKEVEFRITVKLGSLYSQLNGWFFGRVGGAQIDLNEKTQTVTIQGTPSVTPVQTGYMPYPVPEKFKTNFSTLPSPITGNLPAYIISPAGSDSVKSWINYKDYLQTTASHESEVWQMDASPNSYGQSQLDQCAATKSGVTGLLTTNATAYETKPPSWDANEMSLNYQVAGPEFLSNGAKNLGNYLLAIRADVASCLWKTSLQSARAQVEVTDGDGSGNVQLATTTLSQRNGWLYFSASGFHFSAPTIKVKLTAPRMTTITCTKGKTTKKVTAIKPTCPKGFKKKP